MNFEKVPLVLFSGGLDSTFLLLNELMKSPCDTLYVELNILQEEQVKREKAAQEAIFKLIDEYRITETHLYYVREKRKFKAEIDTSGLLFNGFRGFNQVPLWFFSAFLNVNSSKHTSVKIGYVTGDQFAYTAHYLIEAWERLWKACRFEELVPLEFPLLDGIVGKQTIDEYFSTPSTWIKAIASKVTYCETANDGPVCNECPSCKRMAGTAIHKQRLKEVPKPVKTPEPELLSEPKKKTTNKLTKGVVTPVNPRVNNKTGRNWKKIA